MCLKLALKCLCFEQVSCEEITEEGKKKKINKNLTQQKILSISKCSVMEPEL